MKRNKKGFTLIELLVVVVILGILATVGMPQYRKAVETSKATNAVGIAHMISGAYRMYKIDNGGAWLTGQLTNVCNTYANCAAAPAVDSCRLVACNYVAKQDWNGSAYDFSLSIIGGTFASRKIGANPGTNKAPYTAWGYSFDSLGVCSANAGTPACPVF